MLQYTSNRQIFTQLIQQATASLKLDIFSCDWNRIGFHFLFVAMQLILQDFILQGVPQK